MLVLDFPFSPWVLRRSAHVVAETLQGSIDAAEDGALMLRFELIEVAQRNVNAALNFFRRMVSARSPVELLELQVMQFWNQFGTLLREAEELRALVTSIAMGINQGDALKASPSDAVLELLQEPTGTAQAETRKRALARRRAQKQLKMSAILSCWQE